MMRWSLRTKWTLAVLLVAIVPLVVLGVVVLDLQRSGLARAEKELEAAVVDEAATRVIDDLDRMADVGGRVQRLFDDDSLSLDLRIRMIRDIVARTPDLAGAAFFDEQNAFVDAIVPNGQDDPSLHGAPKKAGFELVDGRPRWAGPLAGQLKGWVTVTLTADALDRPLRGLSLDRFGTNDRVYLVDAGRVIGGRHRGDHVPMFDHPWPRQPEDAVVLTTELVDDGVPMVATIRPMIGPGWALVVERPTAEAFAALTKTRRALVGLLLVVLAIAGAAAFLVAYRSLRPLTPLMALVRNYARRDFKSRNSVKSGDELEALGTSLEKMADNLAASETEIARKTRIEENLKRYLPAEAAEAAASGNADDLHLGGAKRRVTVVFADVVSFTTFAERTAPEKTVAFLNELFTILSEVVFRHDGMVDKFIGDCIMAVFRGDDASARALAAAEDMHSFVASNLPRWREEYQFDVELGIGVAAGDALLGNLGSATRMEYTVIGDAVNVAARLEQLARPKQTLATREVADACPDMRFTSLGEHALRGKAHAVEVLEVTS